MEGIKSGKPHSWALVIEGPYALDFVLSDSMNEGLTQLFIRVTSQCRSVICSRCFPVHKVRHFNNKKKRIEAKMISFILFCD